MQTSLQDQAMILIGAATTAASLNSVLSIAKSMSLSVQNAKAVAIRAGDKARGFQPITNFITELANDIIRLVRVINTESVRMSQIAIAQHRISNANLRMHTALNKGGEVRFINSLSPVIKRTDQEYQAMDVKFRAQAQNLLGYFEEIVEKIRSAQVIATNSRVEAAVAEEFRSNLEGVANDLDTASNRIKEQVRICYHNLTELLNLKDKKQ